MLIALFALVAGCGTVRAVREARSAQRAWTDRGTGKEAELPVEPVRLVGWKLPQLVEFAISNRPSMVRARLGVDDARLALREVAADAPLLSTTPWNAVHASASLGHSEVSDRGHGLHGHTDGNASGALSLNVLLYDFGRNDAQARALAEEVVSAELKLVSTGYTIFEEVTATYFSLLQNEALLEVARAKESEFAEHLRQAETMFENGEAKQVDVLKAKLDLAKAAQDVVSASNDVVTAGADLMAALGVDAAMGDYRSVLGDREARLDRMTGFFAKSGGSAAALYDFACTNAPSMQVARAKLRAASHRVDAAVADLYPSVSANVSLDWADPLWYWQWGVSAAQSLLTGWRKSAAVERARLSLDTAAHEVDSAELDLSYALELAVAERDNAAEALATARASVARGKENLETVREQFQVGDVSRVEYTDATADYTSALGDRVRAFYRGQIAESKLYQLAGRMPEYKEETISETDE